jgi:hypothetical protein
MRISIRYIITSRSRRYVSQNRPLSYCPTIVLSRKFHESNFNTNALASIDTYSSNAPSGRRTSELDGNPNGQIPNLECR